MRLTSRIRGLCPVEVLAVGALLLASTILALPTVEGAPASAATLAPCSAANTFVWSADVGNGTAGTTYYILELSNVGSTSCTLDGFARVWAINTAGALVGKPASDRGAAAPVTLAPKSTAHAILGVVDTGALCGTHGVKSQGLRVVPPGQTLPASPGERDEVANYPLEVCSNESSMNVTAVRAGTGIPLYTTS